VISFDGSQLYTSMYGALINWKSGHVEEAIQNAIDCVGVFDHLDQEHTSRHVLLFVSLVPDFSTINMLAGIAILLLEHQHVTVCVKLLQFMKQICLSASKYAHVSHSFFFISPSSLIS
jgi:hypothetical protein